RVSPNSKTPPGNDHSPLRGSVPRRTRTTRRSSRITAPTPTMGRSGYSRDMRTVGGQLKVRPELLGEEATIAEIHYSPAFASHFQFEAQLCAFALSRTTRRGNLFKFSIDENDAFR